MALDHKDGPDQSTIIVACVTGTQATAVLPVFNSRMGWREREEEYCRLREERLELVGERRDLLEARERLELRVQHLRHRNGSAAYVGMRPGCAPWVDQLCTSRCAVALRYGEPALRGKTLQQRRAAVLKRGGGGGGGGAVL